jgi:hypothetical protein
MLIGNACKTCRELGDDLLKLMALHMNAQQELSDAAFVYKDPSAAHSAKVRARVLMQESEEKRARITAHRQIEHGDNKQGIADVVLHA